MEKRIDYYEFDSGDYGNRQFRIDYMEEITEVSWVADDGDTTCGFKLMIDNEHGLISCVDRYGVDCDMVATIGLLIDLEVRGELVEMVLRKELD